MKLLKLLAGVTCIISSVCGVLYIKEKIDEERRLRELTKRGPITSGMQEVKSETCLEKDDGKVITAEFGPRCN